MFSPSFAVDSTPLGGAFSSLEGVAGLSVPLVGRAPSVAPFMTSAMLLEWVDGIGKMCQDED